MMMLGIHGVVAAPEGFFHDHTRGWHWYEPSETPHLSEEKPEARLSPSSPVDRIAAYRKELEQRMAKAWLTPTSQTIQAYMTMQKDLMDRSQRFSDVWMKTLFETPELDHTLVSPVHHTARHVHLDQEKKHTRDTIQDLSRDYGLFFFFSGSCDYCHAFAPIVKQFAEQYGWDVLAISVDGGSNATFPKAIQDNGLYEQWKVSVIPALFAVNPHTGHVMPIAYGMTSLDQMETRVMTLVKGIKG